jgi:hypothetical protein
LSERARRRKPFSEFLRVVPEEGRGAGAAPDLNDSAFKATVGWCACVARGLKDLQVGGSLQREVADAHALNAQGGAHPPTS